MYGCIAMAMVVAATFAGCNVVASASHTSGMPAPVATTNPWLADDRIAEAIEFRVSVGLRSDEAWVREVADDPAAAAGMLAYNVPLLPAEVEAVKDRYTDLGAILDILDEYGALHPSEWAGATQDPSTNSVTARFTANLPDHRANLRNWLPPGAEVNLVQVRWTLLELDVVRNRIRDDWESEWLLENDIYALRLGVNPSANQVELEVSSARADLDAFLEDRYDAGTMLTITSDGTGVRLLPKGTLAGVVVDAKGNPVGGVSIELASSVAGAGPHGDVGYGTNDAGRFRFEGIEAVTYRVLVFTDETFDSRTMLGSSGPVTVVAGTTTNVRVVVTLRVRDPQGLVTPRVLPAGWQLRLSRNEPSSEPPLYARVYAPPASKIEAPNGGAGQLDLYQAFGSPTRISGGSERHEVRVNGESAVLWRDPDLGELLLQFVVDGDGVALVGNEADMTIDELLKIAEGVAPAT